MFGKQALSHSTARLAGRWPGGHALLAGAALLCAALLFMVALPATGQGATAWCTGTGTTDISPDECRALEALYVNTGGDTTWTDAAKSGWLEDRAACSWSGVTCGAATDPSGAQQEIHVEQLNLESSGLSGPLPAELGALSQLAVLNLTNNELTGPIPVELADLSNLQDLSLGLNRLEGAIPSELGRLEQLTTLDLGQNRLSGTIPATLADLSNLSIFFFLDSNQLEGPIPPAVCTMSNDFTTASLEYNKLDVYTSPPECDDKFPNWPDTQTVPPSGVTVTAGAVNTVQGSSEISTELTVKWTPIAFTNFGYYEVFARPRTPAASLLAQQQEEISQGKTGSKADEQLAFTFTAGDPLQFEFFVKTVTSGEPGNPFNQNELVSEESESAALGAVAVRLLDIQANTPLLYVPALAPLALLLLTLLAALAFRRR